MIGFFKSIGIVCIIIFCWKGFLVVKKPIERKYHNKVEQYLAVLEEEKVLFPKVALAQNILETATFGSKVFKENHNMFGMKESRRTFDNGTKNGHANYPHESHVGKCTIECYRPSIKDYAAWQRAFHVSERCFSNEQYIYYLQHLPGGRRYAEDRAYESKLLFILKNIINE